MVSVLQVHVGCGARPCLHSYTNHHLWQPVATGGGGASTGYLCVWGKCLEK